MEYLPLQAFLIATGVVALAEIGDKTQLLSLLLAARYQRPVPIILGILVATLLNHGMAGLVGGWVADQMGPQVLRWVLGASFLLMAGWTLIPDKIDDDEDEQASSRRKWGVFGTTVLAFFVAEMGDKTQIATVALAARYQDLVSVVVGTTVGMMLANVPAVLLGDIVLRKVSMKLVRAIAATVFALLGLAALLDVFTTFL